MRTMPRCVVVIPARLGSTRLARKLLLRETGKSVLQHTYESVVGCRHAETILIATDAQEIAAEARGFGASVVMTRPEAASGTDRVAEAAAALAGIDIVVNVQGDEPELPASAVDAVIEALWRAPQAPMATLATPIRDLDRLLDPACVKVVADATGRARTFSRSPIPYARDGWEEWLQHDPPVFWQHLGIYAYRREFLLRIGQLAPSVWEQTERLEQLRVLDAGLEIQVAAVAHASRGIDTAEDYRQFVLRQAG